MNGNTCNTGNTKLFEFLLVAVLSIALAAVPTLGASLGVSPIGGRGDGDAGVFGAGVLDAGVLGMAWDARTAIEERYTAYEVLWAELEQYIPIMPIMGTGR
jgi:hypothetical protein